MKYDTIKECFQELFSSKPVKNIKDIEDQINEKIKQIKISDISSTIVVPDVGISSEELVRQWLIVSQIIQRQSEIGILNELRRIYDSQESLEDSLQELSELASDLDDFSLDIPSLKKRIKYCKNPLERKSLERQLNAAYKEMKKRR